MTLTQLLVQGILYSMFAVRVPIMSLFPLELSVARPFLFASDLVFSSLLLDVVIPTMIIINLDRNMPDLNSKNKLRKRSSFYVNPPVIAPRTAEDNWKRKQFYESPSKLNIFIIVQEVTEKGSSQIILNNNNSTIKTCELNDHEKMPITPIE